MIRTTKHHIKFANTHKQESICVFIVEYRRVAKLILDDIWTNGYDNFNLVQQTYDLPLFLDYRRFHVRTFLSARVLSSLVTQLSGVIRACTEKQRRRMFQYGITPSSKLKIAIERFKTSCPSVDKLNPELSSKCANFLAKHHGDFMGFVQLKSFGERFHWMNIPIKGHKNSKKFVDQGFELMKSFLITENYITLRWEKEILLRTEGVVVGADQGQITTLALSDGQMTTDDKHGHSLKSICDELARKEKGGHGFKRAVAHRTNYINWSINQLNFDNIKQINLEEVKNLRYKTNTSASLKHFTYTKIEDKIQSMAEERGVHVKMQSSAYRSQRCSGCGWVQKKNRKGKIFCCALCGMELDSDINAASNHTVELPSLRFLVGSKVNRKGFFWIPDGLYDRFGQAFRVPDTFQNDILYEKS